MYLIEFPDGERQTGMVSLAEAARTCFYHNEPEAMIFYEAPDGELVPEGRGLDVSTELGLDDMEEFGL